MFDSQFWTLLGMVTVTIAFFGTLRILATRQGSPKDESQTKQ